MKHLKILKFFKILNHLTKHTLIEFLFVVFFYSKQTQLILLIKKSLNTNRDEKIITGTNIDTSYPCKGMNHYIGLSHQLNFKLSKLMQQLLTALNYKRYLCCIAFAAMNHVLNSFAIHFKIHSCITQLNCPFHNMEQAESLPFKNLQT